MQKQKDIKILTYRSVVGGDLLIVDGDLLIGDGDLLVVDRNLLVSDWDRLLVLVVDRNCLLVVDFHGGVGGHNVGLSSAGQGKVLARGLLVGTVLLEHVGELVDLTEGGFTVAVVRALK